MKWLPQDFERGSSEFLFAVVLVTLIGGCLLLLLPLIAWVIEVTP